MYVLYFVSAIVKVAINCSQVCLCMLKALSAACFLVLHAFHLIWDCIKFKNSVECRIVSVLSTFVGKQTDFVAINIKPLLISLWRHINELISFHDFKIPGFFALAVVCNLYLTWTNITYVVQTPHNLFNLSWKRVYQFSRWTDPSGAICVLKNTLRKSVTGHWCFVVYELTCKS